MSSAKPAAELAARRRLAERLRALRLDAGLSTTQLAQQLGWSQAKVSRIETATHGVAPGDVRSWAEALDVPAAQAEQLVEQSWAASIEVRSWRRELAAGHASKQAEAGQLEQQATLLRSMQHLVVQGLLQTRPYAVALFQRAHPAGTPSQRLTRGWPASGSSMTRRANSSGWSPRRRCGGDRRTGRSKPSRSAR